MNKVKLINVKLPQIPAELRGVFSESDRFRVYINGVFYSSNSYVYEYNSGLNEIIFTFVNLPFDLEQGKDEVMITGKFIEL